MRELTEDKLDEIVADSNKIIVMLGAVWCGGCKKAKPIFEKISTEYDDVEFLFVDADKFPNSRRFVYQYVGNEKGIPTFALFEDGGFITYRVTSLESNIRKLFENFTNIKN